MIEPGFLTAKNWFDIAILHDKPHDGKWFITREVLTFIDKDGEAYIVPVNTPTDFASIPKGLRWWISRIGIYARPAVLHDWLCDKKIVSRKMADKLFLVAMKSIGVGWFKRRIMYTGVRSYSLITRKK